MASTSGDGLFFRRLFPEAPEASVDIVISRCPPAIAGTAVGGSDRAGSTTQARRWGNARAATLSVPRHRGSIAPRPPPEAEVRRPLPIVTTAGNEAPEMSGIASKIGSRTCFSASVGGKKNNNSVYEEVDGSRLKNRRDMQSLCLSRALAIQICYSGGGICWSKRDAAAAHEHVIVGGRGRGAGRGRVRHMRWGDKRTRAVEG